jgi:hypothetical protein
MSEVTMIGLDIAKHIFQVHGVDGAGSVVIRRKLRRGEVPRRLCRSGAQRGLGSMPARLAPELVALSPRAPPADSQSGAHLLGVCLA